MSGERVEPSPGEQWYANNHYTVCRRRITADTPDAPDLIHLSIHDHSRGTRHDWRDFQRIKNELVGPECEGVELFPAESRLVDTANQYHIWVIDSPAFRFPFGFSERLILGPEHARQTGASQRPFEQNSSG